MTIEKEYFKIADLQVYYRHDGFKHLTVYLKDGSISYTVGTEYMMSESMLIQILEEIKPQIKQYFRNILTIRSVDK